MNSIHISWLAVLVAVVANFIFGALWYMPLFGKVWAKEMKMDMTKKPPSSVMVKGMLLGVIGSFFLVYVLAHNMAAWGCVKGIQEMSVFSSALMAAGFTWLGFFVTVDLNGIAWESKSWKLFFINTAYHLLQLLIVALLDTPHSLDRKNTTLDRVASKKAKKLSRIFFPFYGEALCCLTIAS